MMWRDGDVLEVRSIWGPSGRRCAEVEVRNKAYVLLRERDLHAVADENLAEGQPGLYL